MLCALADAEARNELRFGINRHKGPLVADLTPVIVSRNLALLLADIGPDFVDLNTLAGELAHLLVHEDCAAVSDLDHRAQDGIAVCVLVIRSVERIELPSTRAPMI
jgi:hypothetical protein